MTPRSSPAPEVADGPRATRDRPRPHAFALGRSAGAPVVLAFTTLAALAGAVLALLPTLARRRPVGRLGPAPAGEGAGDREAATDPLVP